MTQQLQNINILEFYIFNIKTKQLCYIDKSKLLEEFLEMF